MAIPQKAIGYGNNSTARYVFKCTFSTALSSNVKYEAYDGGTFPAVGSATSVANTILAGTTVNTSTSMVCLVDTSNAAPTSAWMPVLYGGATPLTANPNRLKGLTNYVIQEGGIPGAAGTITWNMVVEIPSDTSTSDTMAFDLLLRYTYTGTAPTLAWFYNDGATGTIATPSWVTVTPGTHGIRHARSGSPTGTYYYANIPASGKEATAEGWVTT